MTEPNIRHVTHQDLDDCFRVEIACFPPSEAASKEIIELRIKRFPQAFFVAEVNGRIVGMINGASTNQKDLSSEELKRLMGHEPDGSNIVVFALAVLPEFQKRGIARELMLRFIGVARKLKKERVMLICKSNLIKYYEGFGFVYVGRSNSTHGGATWHEMHLPLKN